ncbi:hypothetical protein Q8A67_025832 [Cirrhinus molitorella]|uniref:Uncharacterized protein n=1 Tax=Cirrhinus molitorella TaxID=172907 RepID=A0AA88NYD3_9TELE|nr:hypothetical protein Q8A67_025832 [Cirrhinus molitorella]
MEREHHLIGRFLRGAKEINSPMPHLFPTWDLSVVLSGLRSHHSPSGSGGGPASSAPGEGRPSLELPCPVCALCVYVDRTQSVRHSEQLFICLSYTEPRIVAFSRGDPKEQRRYVLLPQSWTALEAGLRLGSST